MKLIIKNIPFAIIDEFLTYLGNKVNKDFEAVGASHIQITNVQHVGLDEFCKHRIVFELNDCVETPSGSYPSDLAMRCFTTFFEGTMFVLVVPGTGFECQFA